MSVYSPYSTPDLANDQAYQRWAQQQRQQAQQAQQQATPQLGQMKQDTGWSSTPNTLGGSVDYGSGLPGMPTYSPSGTGPTVSTFDNVPQKPFPGSSPYGTSYSNPGGAWQPWNIYDGRNNYDGTANDGGYYNVAADSKKGWGPNGQGEFDRDRVWRMTLDAAHAQGIDPGQQDPQNQAKVQQIFLTEVARLKRDYLNTPGLGAQAWANSAFSGYDRLAQGGQPSGQPATSSTDQAWHSAIANASSTPGVNPVSAPAPGSTLPPSPNGTTPTAPLGSGLVQGAQATGAGNNNGIPSVNNQAILQSPDEMLRIVLQRMGINQPLSGPFADFFKQRLSQIVDSAAHIGTLGVGGQSGSQIDNLQNILGSLASSAQGGHFMGDLAGIAGQGLNALRTNPLLTNAPYTQQNELLQRINALNEVGMSPYAAAGLENMYQQGTNDYMAQARQKPAYEMGTGAFPKFLGGTALGQYYGMQP